MTKGEIDKIILDGKLPKDELDNFWENSGWFLLTTSVFVISAISFYINMRNENLQLNHFIFLLISSIILFFTIWSKKTEKNLKIIETNLNSSQNKQLLNKITNNPYWIKRKSSDSYFEITITSNFFKLPTHKLVLICSDKKILYNVRNVGSFRGRAPFSFGMDTWQGIKFRRKVVNYVQQRV
jgi:hypothetical protein